MSTLVQLNAENLLKFNISMNLQKIRERGGKREHSIVLTEHILLYSI